jgi:FdhD protein
VSRRTSIVAVRRVTDGTASVDQDLVAAEAPVAIELTRAGRPMIRSMGVLMRTPGDDDDLVRGWLYTERIIQATGDIVSIDAFESDAAAPDSPGDRITVTLAPHIDIDSLIENRSLTPTSACGLCGRLAAERVDQLRDNGGRPRATDRPGLEAAVISSLPSTLRDGQAVFAETGGLHAAGLFDLTGRLLALREDVGRHNAVDKLVGAALTAGWLPATEAILAVSGRVAYEIVQKAAAAGVAGLVAVGAPSSLAVEAARTIGLTLVGFARDGRFNVYAGHDRLR